MGKKIKKNQNKGFTVRVCPYCGNEIPYNSAYKLFKCKYCKSEIEPEENTVKEVIKYAKSK